MIVLYIWQVLMALRTFKGRIDIQVIAIITPFKKPRLVID